MGAQNASMGPLLISAKVDDLIVFGPFVFIVERNVSSIGAGPKFPELASIIETILIGIVLRKARASAIRKVRDFVDHGVVGGKNLAVGFIGHDHVGDQL